MRKILCSLLLSFLVKISCRVFFIQVTDVDQRDIFFDGKQSSILQIFLRHICTIWLPLMERTGPHDSKWSLLVLYLKQLNSPLLVSEINPESLLHSAVLRDVYEMGQCSGTVN